MVRESLLVERLEGNLGPLIDLILYSLAIVLVILGL